MNYCLRRFISVFILFFLLTLCNYTGSSDAAREAELAPDFSLPDSKNNIVSLSSYRDKQPVILLFWTTQCPLCRSELKLMNNMKEVFSKDGFEVLAIDIGEYAFRVQNFIEKYKLNFKILLDMDTATADTYGIFGVPTYIIIDKKGYVRFRGYTFPRNNYKELTAQ